MVDVFDSLNFDKDANFQFMGYRDTHEHSIVFMHNLKFIDSFTILSKNKLKLYFNIVGEKRYNQEFVFANEIVMKSFLSILKTYFN